VTMPPVTTVVVVIGGIVTVMTFFEKTRSWFASGWTWAMKPMRSTNPHRVELKITPSHPLCTWQEGGHNGNDEMLVYCRLFLTSVGPQASFQILDVTLKEPKVRGQVRVPPGPTEILKHMGARMAVSFDCRFTVQPPVVRSGEIFTGDIILKDQYGEEHRAKRVEFTPVGMRVWKQKPE
jgi:hypothetical protein